MVTDSVRSDIALLHRRLAFGALPPDLDAAAAAGYDAAVSALIGTLGAATPHADAVPRPTLTAAATLRAEKQAGAKGGGARRNEAASIARWWIARMVSTEAPAQERLLWFWHGHFATSVRKVKAPSLVFAQLDAERAASAGPFRDLAAAAIKCPAMLIWLDQAKSTKGHPNENLAREALELFTMGRNRGYAEDDVKAAARALTGWTLDADVAFTVRPATHDPGPETLLARTGSLTGDDLLDLATQHPSTATHLAWKAWTAFAGPVAQDDSVVADVAKAFDGSGRRGDALLHAVVSHPRFREPTVLDAIVRSPVEWLVLATRAVAQNFSDDAIAQAAAQALVGMGQVPFEPPSVGGWPEGAAWLTTGAQAARLRFATVLATRADLAWLKDVAPASRPGVLALRLGRTAWGPSTAAVLATVADRPVDLVTLALVSPEAIVQ